MYYFFIINIMDIFVVQHNIGFVCVYAFVYV